MRASETRLRIAVIGTGISGLSAAWLLSRRHEVAVYEQARRIGGHSNTAEVPGASGPVPVDTGFIVYNPLNYPNLTALFDHLGVATVPSEMSFAVSRRDGALEYSGTNLGGLFAQWQNAFRPRFWSMLADLRRFYRDAPAGISQPGAEHLTLGDFLDLHGYGAAFSEDHLLPMAAAIWSAPAAAMRDCSALAFIRFFENHGLLMLSGRPQWRTVVGGSRAYVAKLSQSFIGAIRRDARVTSVVRTSEGVEVADATGQRQTYDHVVIATHSDEALQLLGDPSAEDRRLLGAIRYRANRVVLHGDPTMMPLRRRAWSSWNYVESGTEPNNCAQVTYWMNRLQSLTAAPPLFVTLDPVREPRSAIRTEHYAHPVFDADAHRAQQALWSLQGRRNIWFCGAYFGAGFHEDGLQAGLAVAEDLGGVRRPWRVDNESGRIVRLPVDGPVRSREAA